MSQDHCQQTSEQCLLTMVLTHHSLTEYPHCSVSYCFYEVSEKGSQARVWGWQLCSSLPVQLQGRGTGCQWSLEGDHLCFHYCGHYQHCSCGSWTKHHAPWLCYPAYALSPHQTR